MFMAIRFEIMLMLLLMLTHTELIEENFYNFQ